MYVYGPFSFFCLSCLLLVLEFEDTKVLRRSYAFLLAMAPVHNDRALHMNAVFI